MIFSASSFCIVTLYCMSFFFFFQAEDGIRDYKVTGVQTCALPISVNHLKMLLEGMLSDASQRLANLQYVTAEERLQLTVGWNSSGRKYPSDVTLHRDRKSVV